MAHILIAEDERDIRELIELALMFGGHQVTVAFDGQDALEKATASTPDLIMMDVRMPRMTGYEACRRMKELDHLKDVPVAFLTAKGQDEEVQSGIESGAVAYILKPFALDELTARVTSILTEAGVSS